MGLLDSLDMGKKGLAAAQLSMDITGQNITNANTEGYSRKRVMLSADTRQDGQLGQIGNGVNVDGVQRMRNEFLDQQMNERIADQGRLQQIDDSLERVENIFNEPTDSALSGNLDRFWNAWSDLSNNPSDYASREAVKTTTEVLTSQFRTIAGQLQDFKMSINEQIKTQITQINSLAATIKKYNDEVSAAEIGGAGSQATESRDKRTQAIKDLAELIPIDYVEDAQGRYTVTTDGNMLIGPYDVFKLKVESKVQTESSGQNYAMYFCQIEKSSSTYQPKTGVLGGLFEVRDTKLQDVQDQLDTVASSLVKNVNEAHLNGYDLDSDTGIHFFDPTKTTAAEISLSADIIKDSRNIAAAATNSVTNVNLPAEAVNAGPPATIDLTHGNTTPLNRFVMAGTLRIENTTTSQVYQEGSAAGQGDYWVDYKSGMIQFNPALNPTPTQVNLDFKIRDAQMSGVGDGRSALEIANLKEKAVLVPDAAGNQTQSVQEYYGSVMGNLGITRNESKNNLETAKFIVQQIDQRQQEIAGVSLDEEMANMIKFEHSYQASARYISTINSMMDAVLGLVS